MANHQKFNNVESHSHFTPDTYFAIALSEESQNIVSIKGKIEVIKHEALLVTNDRTWDFSDVSNGSVISTPS